MERDILSAEFIAGLASVCFAPGLSSTPISIAPSSELEAVSADRTHESLDVRDTASGYDAWSATYDVRMNPLLMAEQPAILCRDRDHLRGRALDAGCGTGRLTRLLADAGHEVIGIDTLEPMLRRAQMTTGGVISTGLIFDPPFPDESSHIVCCGVD